MLNEIIPEYLSRHRRLIIPQLGAFVVKVPEGDVVFSELLRRDDGVLRSLLVERCGVSELEAAGAIDRLVFEVRHALEHGESYCIEGFGSLHRAASGAVLFTAVPRVSPEGEKPATGEPVPAVQSVAEPEPAEAEESDNGIAEPKISTPANRNPEPYVKGLQYGKPRRINEGYTYVGNTPRRKVDTFVVVAVIVAILAVGVIVYGYLRKYRIEQLEQQHMEQMMGGDYGVPVEAVPTEAELSVESAGPVVPVTE